jgi:hypothetical protein
LFILASAIELESELLRCGPTFPFSPVGSPAGSHNINGYVLDRGVDRLDLITGKPGREGGGREIRCASRPEGLWMEETRGVEGLRL